MKLIILAAGTGSRLKSYTKNNHKSLLELSNNETILGRLIYQFRKCGIKKITIITGHKSNLIKKKFKKFANIKFYKNYNKTNNLHTLLHFKRLMKNDDIVISFSDVVTQESVIKNFLKKKNSNFSLAIDKSRIVSGTMKVKLRGNNILKIGKIKKKEAHGNFIGISKIPYTYLKLFVRELEQVSHLSKKHYYTEVFNKLIKLKEKVVASHVGNKWVEVDNISDYYKAKKFVNPKKF